MLVLATTALTRLSPFASSATRRTILRPSSRCGIAMCQRALTPSMRAIPSTPCPASRLARASFAFRATTGRSRSAACCRAVGRSRWPAELRHGRPARRTSALISQTITRSHFAMTAILWAEIPSFTIPVNCRNRPSLIRARKCNALAVTMRTTVNSESSW